ncbi:acyl-CoA dehydrogenase [Methylopila henanensis]|uniref:Acyl-CoA dehydrogenase n=1 Tax=Methylopila henanensis TaxID=873516 RepID=A0ABW4K3E6_9HYPH
MAGARALDQHAFDTSPDPDGETVLARTRAISDGALRAKAHAIDEGHYPLEIMRDFARVGALSAHLKSAGGNFGLAIDAMRAGARQCGSTGFLMWCHGVFGLYLDHSENRGLADRMLPPHAAGETFGGTALSNPMKSFAGIEPMALKAVRVPGGYRVTGTLPWVSHIGRGQYCGAIAQAVDASGAPSHEIMFVLRCDEPVELRQCPVFSGMEGTSTWGLRLADVRIDDADLIADPAKPFIAKIRAAFILLQLGMGLGVTEGAIDSMLEVESVLEHVNQYLDNRPDEIAGELDELAGRVAKLAETPFETSTDYLIDVLDARAQASELSLRSTQSALLHQGARGYLMSAAPQRRVREAHFVAIVTPAIKHLRSEMTRLSKVAQPAGLLA